MAGPGIEPGTPGSCVSRDVTRFETEVKRHIKTKLNIELNDLRLIICLRKYEVTVERISVCYVIEKLMEHGIHCRPCLQNNDVIDMLQ